VCLPRAVVMTAKVSTEYHGAGLCGRGILSINNWWKLFSFNEGETYGGCTNTQVIAKCFARKCVLSCLVNI